MIQPKVQVEIPDAQYWKRQVRCQAACPVHTDARGYVRAVAEGDFERAYLIARGPNPLASICGRICGAPCEASCRRGLIDQPVSIRALKRFVTERYGPESRHFEPLDLLRRVLATEHRDGRGSEELSGLRRLLGDLNTRPTDGPRVAIIGAGPAGLAAAHDLALLGMRPTIFESEPIPGGMLAVGIPAYRLPRDLIQAEIDVIRALGVRFECNVLVGKDITFEKIRADYSATIIAVGAKRSRRLQTPGAEGPGVLGGVEFLRDVALGKPLELGQRVIVIGGGNVAYDVSRSVVRQIALDVSRSALRQEQVREAHMVSLESLEELPADDVEIIEGDEEGVYRHHRLGPYEILRHPSGAVRGVVFQRVLSVFDASGRFAPKFDAADTVTIEGDTVIWAIGQTADLSLIPSDSDVALTERGMIACDVESLSTSAPDVFVAGDVAYGARLLIDAVASGKRAARSVHHYLTGKTLATEQVMVHLPVLRFEREADYEKQTRVGVPVVPPAVRLRSQETQVETGYSPELACREADRCLDCGTNTVFDSDKCIACGGCVDVCPEQCLRLVSVTSLDCDERLTRLIEARFAPDELAGASAMIKDESRCIRCALCAYRCPVDAITMERMTFEETWMEA